MMKRTRISRKHAKNKLIMTSQSLSTFTCILNCKKSWISPVNEKPSGNIFWITRSEFSVSASVLYHHRENKIQLELPNLNKPQRTEAVCKNFWIAIEAVTENKVSYGWLRLASRVFWLHWDPFIFCLQKIHHTSNIVLLYTFQSSHSPDLADI